MTGGPGRLLQGARLPVLLGLMVLSGVGGAQAWGQEGLDDIRITDPRIIESSALASSPTDDGLLYTVNDSGHDPIVFVVERAGGDVVGTTLLEGLDPDAIDPEAMAVQGDRLWVADTGDNKHERDDVALYALPAPGRGDRTVRPDAYPLRYANDNPDVEALLMPPGGEGGWLVTKEAFGGQVLMLPPDMRAGEPVVPEPLVGVSVPGPVTDGTMLPGGKGAVLRRYGSAGVYRVADWSQVGVFDLPSQEQGESITVLPDGATVLAGSEGSPALIDAVDLPTEALAALNRPVGSGSKTDRERPRTDREQAPAKPKPASSAVTPTDHVDEQILVIAGALGAIVVVGGLLWLRRLAAHRRA